MHGVNNDIENNMFLLTDQVFVMAFILLMIQLLDDGLLYLLQQNVLI